MKTPLRRQMPEILRGLYAITPDESDGAHLLAAASAVLAGGCRWLQYRDKRSEPSERRQRGEALADLCRRRGAALVINDDVELAGAVGAAGVHLGQGDGDPAAARERLPAGAIVGVTCHDDFDLARKACAAGADYVAFGAVFPSPTKPKAVVAPLELFARCRRELALPACAIGGVTLANAPLTIAAGADLVAVITDLFSAPDLTVRAFAYQRLFEDSLS